MEAGLQPLSEPAKKRKEWMELMMEFTPGLYRKIADEKNKRQNSYLQILCHIRKINPKASNQDQHAHYSEALKEAKNYIIADRKWIALKEIDKQCQEIENHESFHTEQETLINHKSNERTAVASVIFAFKYCENELREVHGLDDVRNWLNQYFTKKFVLQAEEAAKGLTTEIKENILGGTENPKKGTEVTRDAKQTKVKAVAEDNGIRLRAP